MAIAQNGLEFLKGLKLETAGRDAVAFTRVSSFFFFFLFFLWSFSPHLSRRFRRGEMVLSLAFGAPLKRGI
jgi:hypothetical protein